MLPQCTFNELELFDPHGRHQSLAQQWGCSPLTAAVTLAAGLDAPAVCSDSLGRLVRMTSLGSGEGRMTELFARSVPGAKVLVYGDYDVDGVSSTAMAMTLARAMGAKSVNFYIPHRSDEGYGFHADAVQRAQAAGVQVVIVTDCGTKDDAATRRAQELGMKVLTFDHHLVEGQLAAPDALLNPQTDGSQEAKTLCATAVLWVWALRSGLFNLDVMDRLSQLAALATVSDCMPLEALNKAIIRRGLAVTKKTPLPGLARLYEAFELDLKTLTEEDWSMKVIPCLNAPGRLALADLSVQVLTGSGDLARAVASLVDLNKRRRDLATSISMSLTRSFKPGSQQVFYDSDWPVGLLSAIASRLCSQNNSAVALASRSGEMIRGTLRVPEGANAVALLKDLEGHLEKWGGHPFAAGFSVTPQKWPLVSSLLNEVLSNLDVEPTKEKAIVYDAGAVTKGDLEDLAQLGPFGKGNPQPLFFMPCQGDVVLPLGKTGRHSKIVTSSAQLIAFDGARQLVDLSKVGGWLYRPRVDTWGGKSRAQFIVEKIVMREEVGG